MQPEGLSGWCASDAGGGGGRRRGRLGGAALALIALLGGVAGCAGVSRDPGSGPPEQPAALMPWEWWRDPAMLSVVPETGRTVMRSSHCPTGCAHDRHAAGDSRFLRRTPGGEGVIFEAEGAGAVTRIWMVMGDGVSEPLDPSIRLRVRLDGRRRPAVDLPLPELFSGTTPPFLAPAVADRTVSGGGNVSYVPIAFRNGCQISLVGADEAKIWFQIAARLVDDPRGVRTFTGEEDLEGLGSALRRLGADPWPGPPTATLSGSAQLAPGESAVIADLEGPDMISGLLIRAPRKHWPRLGVRLAFDGGEPQLVPALDLFGLLGAQGEPTRTLLVGADAQDDLAIYLPMPFLERATVELLRRPVEGPARIRVEYAVRTAGRAPPPGAGVFTVQVRRHAADPAARELTLLELPGAGSWVGLVADLAPVGGSGWTFLEGDERVLIGGEATPSWHGTGVEDLFNGGFYFRAANGQPTSFSTALAGASVLRRQSPRAVMARLLLGDAVVFRGGISATLETGPEGELGLTGRTVAFVYVARPVGGPEIR
jgi:hypothetical protein